MKLFTDKFNLRDCIRLEYFIRLIESLYLDKKLANKNLLKLNDIRFRVNQNISTYNNTYKSLHHINDYKKIKDLLIDIFADVNNIHPDLHIVDLFTKKWSYLESVRHFGLNKGENFSLFHVKNMAVQSINYNFHNYCALFFTENCQIFYDDIGSYNFDKSVICPQGSVLLLENEHFVVKQLYMFYSIGLGFAKAPSIINTIINNDNLSNERYIDLEIA